MCLRQSSKWSAKNWNIRLVRSLFWIRCDIWYYAGKYTFYISRTFIILHGHVVLVVHEIVLQIITYGIIQIWTFQRKLNCPLFHRHKIIIRTMSELLLTHVLQFWCSFCFSGTHDTKFDLTTATHEYNYMRTLSQYVHYWKLKLTYSQLDEFWGSSLMAKNTLRWMRIKHRPNWTNQSFSPFIYP